MRITASVALGLFLASCAPSNGERVASSAPTPSNARCTGSGVAVDTAFDTGALASCQIDKNGAITISIAPEDSAPINCSAWYSFRLTRTGTRTQAQSQPVDITLTYEECGHRYWPKISIDGENWTRLPENNVQVEEVNGRKQAKLSVPLGSSPVFISAQEIIGPAQYDAWLDKVEHHPDVTRFMLGQSAEGRDIEAIRIGNKNAAETIILVGRQHPPEITGALAMFPFMETLLLDDEATKAFRKRFQIIAVPLLNPDGVVKGYWRHNTGSLDLNRDWGPFTQPETQLMQNMLRGIADNPSTRLRLLIDFHSTARDVFYTIPDELPTDPELFTHKWLTRYQERMPGYTVDRDARHEVGRPISKAHAYDTYGVPAITFELGDETDRDLIKRIGKQSAIAMIEVLETAPE